LKVIEKSKQDSGAGTHERQPSQEVKNMATQTTSSNISSGKPAKPSAKTTGGKGKSASSATGLSPVAKPGRSIEKGRKPRGNTAEEKQNGNQQRDDLDMAHFRVLLIDERKRLEEELEQVRNHSTDMDNALPEEGEGGDEDTADLASAMMDKEMDLSVEDELEDILVQVDRAFQKIEEGTYGICDVSGKPIPASRLELIPFATLTVECQALAES